jgi:hypothetical protein
MGTGRSGTTILEILLSNNPGVVGVGEITHVFRDGVIRDDICSCGSKANNCSFWGRILKKIPFLDILSNDYEALFRKFDWHLGFFKQVLNRFDKRDIAAYNIGNKILFDGVSELSNCDWIVDSSKYASRAVALSRAFPGQVKIICLTRSPHGLINAFKRIDTEEQKPKRLFFVFLYYIFVVGCCRIAITVIGRQNCSIVAFENLISDTDSVLRKIEKDRGVALGGVKKKIDRDEFLKIHHILTGNRLRKKGKIKFKKNQNSHNKLNSMEKIAASIMAVYGSFLGFKY